MKVFNRTDFPSFKWDTLDGKQGTIRIGRDGFNDLVAFHADDGGLYVLAWIDRRTGVAVSDILDGKSVGDLLASLMTIRPVDMSQQKALGDVKIP